MTPVEVLLEKLPGARRAGNGWSARCPAHEDRRASLSVSEGDDGRALVKCHAGCPAEAVAKAAGLRLADLMPATNAPNPRIATAGNAYPSADAAVAALERGLGRRSASWSYENARGDPVGVVVRWDRAGGKDIRPVARHPDGWRVGEMPGPRPLYGLPALLTAAVVLVVEGEKAADAARRLGFVATTSAGGSQAAGKTDWRPLAGKEVWLFPDNDPSGRTYADTVVALLAGLAPAPTVRLVELPGLPEKGDLVDWIDAQGDAAEPADLRGRVEALARAVQPEVGVPPAGPTVFRPFPLDALPEPVRGFVAAGARAIGCDPSYLALPLLVELAAAIGNSRRLELKRGWAAPPILWAAVVGESGTAKTPAFKLVMRPVRERQQRAFIRHREAMEQYTAEYARWEKAYAAWKRDKNADSDPPAKPTPPPGDRYVVSDTTVEALAPILLANPRGLLLARDELNGWLGSFDRYAGKGSGGSDSANWLSLFNAEDIVVDRKTGTPPTITVPKAAVCVSGGIQPGILHRALGATHRESGLAARLLLTCPPRRAKRWTEDDVDPRAEAGLARLADRMFDLQPEVTPDGACRPVLVRLTAEAKRAWITYYDEHALEQTDLTGDLSAAWSKLEEYAARLALVVHYARWAAGDASDELWLDGTSMAAGIRLTGWFKREACRVYAMLDESDDDRDQRRLAEWIDRKGGSASVREVQQGCRWLKEPGAAEAALEGLTRAGRGRWRPVPTTANGGRPTRVFELSTPSTVYETLPTQVESGGSVDVDTVEAAEGGADAPLDFPFGANNPDDPDGRELFPESRGLPD